jgi:hypothetical protein
MIVRLLYLSKKRDESNFERKVHRKNPERIGGGSAATGFQWQWGDAENAIDKWCEMLTERLSSWTSGTATP